MEEHLLVDRFGQALQRERPPSNFARSKSKGVITGDVFGAWAGRDYVFQGLPGGAMLQFDLSRLTLADFRSMRDHYQINASLSVLTFILHQIDWSIECENQEIKDMIETNMRATWTQLIRALSQAFWAGYSPSVINFENDTGNGYVIIDKFKDLVPEECSVNWKETKGYAPPGDLPPTLLQYDGILHRPMGTRMAGSTSMGAGKAIPIPPENSLWYPTMMENGDYYGRKLLRPAFPAWYFSQIIHLFANRYYERFGEPVPIGRADFDAELDAGNGETVTGKQAMETILSTLRNRSVVILPSDRDPATKEYDYDVSYLESQMRGTDFERYLSRLDEEMSLAVFTPVLLFRTADVGSYNLGQSHLKIFLWMINSLTGDLKFYIQKYVVNRLLHINFGENAPKADWVYRKLGKEDVQLYGPLLQALVAGNIARPDLEELGTAVGLTLHEVEQVTEAPPMPGPEGEEAPPGETDDDGSSPTGVIARYPTSLDGCRVLITEAIQRAASTFRNGHQVSGFALRRKFMEALVNSGADTRTAAQVTGRFYDTMNRVLPEVSEALAESLRAEDYATVLGNLADEALEVAVA